MDSFKFWIFSICGASAITAVFKILLSNSSLNKVLNIFFSLFVLFYTVIPLQSIFSDNKKDIELNSTENAYEEFYENGYRNLIERSVKNECLHLSVQVLSFEMDAYIDDEGYLMVNSIDITIDCKDRSEEVKAHLKQRLGFEVNVS